MGDLEQEIIDFINGKLGELTSPEQRIAYFDLLARLAKHEVEHARWLALMQD